MLVKGLYLLALRVCVRHIVFIVQKYLEVDDPLDNLNRLGVVHLQDLVELLTEPLQVLLVELEQVLCPLVCDVVRECVCPFEDLTGLL